MSSIFFGDSLTAGENSPAYTSFPYLLDAKLSTLNAAVSGTTFGEYSIYPVDGHSLLSTYPKVSTLSMFTDIYLEYGVNDVSAILCGFTTLQTVIVSFVKALDGIRQINPDANIRFLAVSLDHDIIMEHSKLQCDYLKNDYFKGYDFNFPVALCADNYEKIVHAVSKRVKVVPMIDDIAFFHENAECISNDNLHPNEKGHIIIADTIKKYI